MVYIPYTNSQWAAIEHQYRGEHPDDDRKRLPIREVGEWWAAYSVRHAAGWSEF